MTTSTTLVAVVDGAACKGHGRCFMVAPTVFDCDDEGFATVIGAAADDSSRNALDRARSNCPERAITVETV